MHCDIVCTVLCPVGTEHANINVSCRPHLASQRYYFIRAFNRYLEFGALSSIVIFLQPTYTVCACVVMHVHMAIIPLYT